MQKEKCFKFLLWPDRLNDWVTQVWWVALDSTLPASESFDNVFSRINLIPIINCLTPQFSFVSPSIYNKVAIIIIASSSNIVTELWNISCVPRKSTQHPVHSLQHPTVSNIIIILSILTVVVYITLQLLNLWQFY